MAVSLHIKAAISGKTKHYISSVTHVCCRREHNVLDRLYVIDVVMHCFVCGSCQQVSEEVSTICAMVSIGSSVFYKPKDKAVHAENAHRAFSRGNVGDHIQLLQVYQVGDNTQCYVPCDPNHGCCSLTDCSGFHVPYLADRYHLLRSSLYLHY